MDMRARLLCLVFSVIFLLLFVSCGTDKITREDVPRLPKQEIKEVLTDETVFSGVEYDEDTFLLRRHPKKKCVAAHTLYITSRVSGTHNYYAEFSGGAVVINDYVITTELAVPDIEVLAEILTKRRDEPFPVHILPSGMEAPPGVREVDEQRKGKAEKIELDIITVLSADYDGKGYKIEILKEVFRDQEIGIVLLKRSTGKFAKYRDYTAPTDCSIILADTSSIETGPDKSYGLGIAGHNFDLSAEKQVISVEYGELSYFDRKSHELYMRNVSVLLGEVGGAVYLALDGEPHLAGVVIRAGAPLPYGHETVAIAIEINYLIKLFRENGFDLFPEEDIE